MEFVVGNRYRVFRDPTIFQGKVGRAIAFDPQCGSVYLVFRAKGINGRHLMTNIQNCKLYGKLKKS